MSKRPALVRAAAAAAAVCAAMTGIAAAPAVAVVAVRVSGAVPADSAGTWGTPVVVPGLAALNKGGLANVNSVSCAAHGGYAALAAMEYLTCGVGIPANAFPPTG